MRALLALFALTVAVEVPPAPARPSLRLTLADSGRRAHHQKQQQRRVGRILGVFDATSNAPLEGAEVVDLFVDAVYRTQASGLVGLWAFQRRNDSVAVRVRRIGYADTAFVVMVGAADTTPISVFLNRTSSLPAVIVDALANKRLSPNMAEFEGRVNDKSLTGRFLTKDDLDKHSSKPIGDVLHDLMAGKARGCSVPPIYYFDGIRTATTAVFFDTVAKRADDYQGIEFYTAAAAPLRFGGTLEATGSMAGTMAAPKTATTGSVVAGAAGPSGSSSSIRAASSCGVVLLWRREKP